MSRATVRHRPARRVPSSLARWRVPLAALGVLLLAVVLIGVDRAGGRGGGPNLSAIPDVVRAGAATLLLFGACGYAPARLLLPEGMRGHLPLLVLPVGAAASGLALTPLGFFGVPLPVSLAVVLLLGIGGAVVVTRRRPRESSKAARAGGLGLRILWPAAIALTVAALLVSPLFRPDSFATVLGQNGDAHLAAGTAKFLEHDRPGAEDTALPIDHVPFPWRSKIPIYYCLAAASALSGLDPVQTFATVSAVVAALVPLGFFLVALYVLGAGPAAALAGMALVGVDRILFRLAIDPFYNQLWGLAALPFLLLFGWRYLHEPSRRSLVLFGLFGAIEAFAYPLLVPFPALFLGVSARRVWRRARERGETPGWLSAIRLPRGRRSLLLYVPAGILLGPVALVLIAAVLQKAGAAFIAALPGGDLSPWSGKDLGYYAVYHFVGLPDAARALLLVTVAFAIVGLRRVDREAALGLGAMLGALLLAAAWFRLRGHGELFHFRALGFFGPTLVMLTGVGLWYAVQAARPLTRYAAAAGGAALALAMLVNVRDALAHAFPHVTPRVWQLRTWNDRLPRNASIRVDVTPIGVQQWAYYMLSKHPLTASHPLRAFFPYPPVGRKADYLLVNRRPRPPRDAAGAPVLENRDFALYRMRAGVPGPDRSSRRMVDPFEMGGNKAGSD